MHTALLKSSNVGSHAILDGSRFCCTISRGKTGIYYSLLYSFYLVGPDLCRLLLRPPGVNCWLSFTPDFQCWCLVLFHQLPGCSCRVHVFDFVTYLFYRDDSLTS